MEIINVGCNAAKAWSRKNNSVAKRKLTTDKKQKAKTINLCNMLNFRENLRIMAMIIACLAVTAVFASCDKDGSSDEDGGGGSNNSPLAGWTWRCNMPRQVYRLIGGEFSFTFEVVEDFYMFKRDGTFLYFPYDERFTYYDGTYSVSNGKLTFKNVNRRDTETDEIETNVDVQNIIEMEYKIDKDEKGEFLNVGSLQYFRNSSTVDISRANDYRKAESIK